MKTYTCKKCSLGDCQLTSEAPEAPTGWGENQQEYTVFFCPGFKRVNPSREAQVRSGFGADGQEMAEDVGSQGAGEILVR